MQSLLERLLSTAVSLQRRLVETYELYYSGEGGEDDSCATSLAAFSLNLKSLFVLMRNMAHTLEHWLSPTASSPVELTDALLLKLWAHECNMVLKSRLKSLIHTQDAALHRRGSQFAADTPTPAASVRQAGSGGPSIASSATTAAEPQLASEHSDGQSELVNTLFHNEFELVCKLGFNRHPELLALLLRENAKLAGRGAGSKKELRFLSADEIAQSRPTLWTSLDFGGALEANTATPISPRGYLPVPHDSQHLVVLFLSHLISEYQQSIETNLNLDLYSV